MAIDSRGDMGAVNLQSFHFGGDAVDTPVPNATALDSTVLSSSMPLMVSKMPDIETDNDVTPTSAAETAITASSIEPVNNAIRAVDPAGKTSKFRSLGLGVASKEKRQRSSGTGRGLKRAVAAKKVSLEPPRKSARLLQASPVNYKPDDEEEEMEEEEVTDDNKPDDEEEEENNSNRVGRWTTNEHRLYLRGMKLHGRNWSKVSRVVRTRSREQVKSRFWRVGMRA